MEKWQLKKPEWIYFIAKSEKFWISSQNITNFNSFASKRIKTFVHFQILNLIFTSKNFPTGLNVVPKKTFEASYQQKKMIILA